MLTALAASNSAPNQLPSPDLTSSSPIFHQANPSVSSTSAATPQWPFENGKTNVHLSSTSAKSLQHPTRNFEGPIKSSTRTLCHCPQAMSTLLDDSRGRCGRISIQNTHFILAHIKTALHQCTQILDCNYCSDRSDHMMLATVASNKLVSTLEEVVRVYTQRGASSIADVDQHEYSDTNFRRHPRHYETRTNCYDLFIGDYAINSEVEWAAVMKALIILLKRTFDLLEQMKEVASAKGRETQVHMLWEAEQRARQTAGSMRDGVWPWGGG